MRHEYKIHTEVEATPKAGGFYRDADGDLFIWVGGDAFPWLEITELGACTRRGNYPVEPLLELSPADYQAAIAAKRPS